MALLTNPISVHARKDGLEFFVMFLIVPKVVGMATVQMQKFVNATLGIIAPI